jgi:periplasmic divalent cation tolerance protein
MKVYYQVVLTTCANAEQAKAIAHALVEESLAACVNVVPQIQSVYLWQGSVQSDAEYLLVIKSSADKFAAIETRIKALHSYELPEIIAVPIIDGSAEYLAWLGAPDKS